MSARKIDQKRRNSGTENPGIERKLNAGTGKGSESRSPKTENPGMGRMLAVVILELIFSYIISNLNTLVLNRFSADAVAATTAVATFLSLMVNLYAVFYVGAGILLAPYWGRKRYQEGCQVWTVALFDNFLFGIVLGAVGMFGNALICRSLQVPLELRDMAGGYLAVALGLSLFQGFTLTCTAAFRAIGNMKTVMLGNTLINGSCVFMNFLILVLVPARAQNIYQFAFAGILSQIFGCLFYLWSASRDARIELRIFHVQWRREFGETSGKIFRLGFLGGMEGVIYLISQTIVTSMIGSLGTRALMVKGYSANLTNYLTLPSSAFSLVAATMIGLAIGRGDEEQVKRCMKKSVWQSLLMALALEGIVLLFGRSFLTLYVSDGEILRECMWIIIIDFAVELCRCVAAIMVSSLKAIGDVQTPFFMVIAGSLMNVGISWLLGIRLGLGLPGIWAGYGMDLFFRGGLGLLRWRVHVARHSYPVLRQAEK